jgi:hypothetical protein
MQRLIYHSTVTLAETCGHDHRLDTYAHAAQARAVPALADEFNAVASAQAIDHVRMQDVRKNAGRTILQAIEAGKAIEGLDMPLSAADVAQQMDAIEAAGLPASAWGRSLGLLWLARCRRFTRLHSMAG